MSQTNGERSLDANTTRNYYYSVSVDDDDQLEAPNLYAALDNPLKGLMGSPWFGYSYNHNTTIPSTLEWFYIGLNSIMFGDPDVVGIEAAFNWTDLDARLDQTASRHKHVAFTTVVHYPGWEGLAVPQYLLDAGMPLHSIGGDYLGSDVSPHYGDSMLLRCFEQFIAALGARYDGDPRIGFIHLGLLGYWGEWHTFPHDLVPGSSMESIIQWYAAAFNTTRMHTRFPSQLAYDLGFGLYDSSFTTETLGGDYNDGVDYHFYFWTNINNMGLADFWKRAPMSAETRPENQGSVFKPDYVPGYKAQSMMDCINQTHASYILHNHAFELSYIYVGEELENALAAHVGMGYNFIISSVSVAVTPKNKKAVDIDVVVQQIGVAPFYYDLSLVFDCPDLEMPVSRDGVERIIEQGDVATFSFLGVPSTITCLSHVTLSLASSYAYDERPVKFSQGTDGSNLTLMIPTPLGLVENIDVDGAGGVIDIDGTRGNDKSGVGVVMFALVLLAVSLAIVATIVSAWYKTRQTKPDNSSERTEASPNDEKSTAPTDYSSYSPSSLSTPKKELHNSFFSKNPPRYFEAVPE